MPLHNSSNRLLACLLPLLVPVSSLVIADEDPSKSSASYEFPGWDRKWVGTLGNKQVEVSLTRVGDQISGTYCYQPCTLKTRTQLALTGRMSGGGAELAERDNGKGNAITGLWQIESNRDGFVGKWKSPSGAQFLGLDLRPDMTGFKEAFPYEIRLVANHLPDEGDDSCFEPPFVSAIRLYKDGKLFQSLPAESQGTCGVLVPSLIDANFDGWPDLTIAQFLPAGPNIPHQTWLYDPMSGRFVEAPPILQGITSPEFDSVHQIVYTFWRASCCEHGITTYRWKGEDVEEVESWSSYLLPVLDNGQRLLCYIVPKYGDGFIDFATHVYASGDGRIELQGLDPTACEAMGDSLYGVHFPVWKHNLNGKPPTVLRTEFVTWKKAETPAGQRYCPEVPFIDKVRIRHIVLSENPELCDESEPK
ncbi:nitrite reductase [Pseudomonas denitrificans (nom. rej.)]|nr:nitrite reductase [Pseudomonas denitrificans (nom. rej.)]